MLSRPTRADLQKAVLGRVGLLALFSSLIVIGIWLDQQFDASRGPVRDASPELVVWISLTAVGLVLALWVTAALSARRKPGVRGSRGGRS